MKNLILIIGFLPIGSVFAQNLDKDSEFEKLWNKIYSNGLVSKASHESVESSRLNFERANKHWYPTVYATGNSFVTNDSGTNMFGLLSQRSIEQADFIPDKLNHPDSKLLTKGALGINLSLYEGGMKEAISKASKFQYEAAKNDNEAKNINFYSEVAKNYFLLNVSELHLKELLKVKNNIELILSRYTIGNKSNMLGYSGLLGLKSIKNRVDATIGESKAKSSVFKNALKELSGEEVNLSIQDEKTLMGRMSIYLPSTQKQYEETSTIKNLNLNALAAHEVINAEKSRNLPRVGVFAESYAFNGDRKMATGFSTGIYLNWNLFSGNDIGASDQAIHNSHAAKYYAEAFGQKEKIEFNSLNELEETLNSTLVTLNDSEKLLDEQANVASNLFKNGMINALQLTEVISRRIDLLNSKAELATKLVETKSRKINLENNKPDILK